MAYLLNSNAVGMKFNDSTTIVSNSQVQKMKYVDFLSKNEQRNPDVFNSNQVPENLNKKHKIITYYLKELKNKKQNY